MVLAWMLAVSLATVARTDSTYSLRIVTAPAETLAVTVHGAGPAIVIVPGVLGGSFGFRHVSARLTEAGHRVIVVEPLGIGGSARPQHADYSFEAQAGRVAAALDTLKATGAILVIHAAGASVGYRLARARPDLVRAIVSINGGPSERLDTPSVRTALRFAPILKIFGARGRARKKLAEGLRESSHDPAWVTDSIIDTYGEPYARDLWGTLKTLERMSHAANPEPIDSVLSRVDVPVLLLRSEAYRAAITENHLSLLQARVSQLHIEPVEAAGQYIHEERPEVVVQAILTLSVSSSASPRLRVSNPSPRLDLALRNRTAPP